MKIGLVGKPSSGKSTFFKAATLIDVAIANYPFTTIKPNIGMGYVRTDCVERFFKVKCSPREGYCVDGQRFVPVEMVDVAWLVPGAHEGRGMGNQFLDDLRQGNALIHIVDISGGTDENGEIVTDFSHDPLKDVIFLEEELNYWFVNILKRAWKDFCKSAGKDVYKVLSKQLSAMQVDDDMAKRALSETSLDNTAPRDWEEDDMFKLATRLRELSKPIIIAANKVDAGNGEKNFSRLKDKFYNRIIIPCSAEVELALRQAGNSGIIRYLPGDCDFKVLKSVDDRMMSGLNFIRSFLDKWKSTGIQGILNNVVFDILRYSAIFPGGVSKLEDKDGNILPDCFLMPPDSTAIDFAYRLHTDFGDRFIRAIDVKKRLTVSREYKLKSGDVIEIIYNK